MTSAVGDPSAVSGVVVVWRSLLALQKGSKRGSVKGLPSSRSRALVWRAWYCGIGYKQLVPCLGSLAVQLEAERPCFVGGKLAITHGCKQAGGCFGCLSENKWLSVGLYLLHVEEL